MDTAITQDTALAEIIELVIGNQTEFTKDGVKALVKTIFQIYEQAVEKQFYLAAK